MKKKHTTVILRKKQNNSEKKLNGWQLWIWLSTDHVIVILICRHIWLQELCTEYHLPPDSKNTLSNPLSTNVVAAVVDILSSSSYITMIFPGLFRWNQQLRKIQTLFLSFVSSYNSVIQIMRTKKGKQYNLNWLLKYNCRSAENCWISIPNIPNNFPVITFTTY